MVARVRVLAVLAMHTELTAAAAQFLSGQADELRRELDDIAQSWGNLGSKWTGIASAGYEPAWDEWHDDAVTVTAVLVEHADALVRAVALLVEHEERAAAALASVVPPGQEAP
jgi:WXG100 family type VII secretion target